MEKPPQMVKEIIEFFLVDLIQIIVVLVSLRLLLSFFLRLNHKHS
jgi:hypothetical protein